MKVKYPKIKVKLIGTDGNAFNIIAKVKSALTNELNQKYNLNPHEIKAECDKFFVEATSGNYDHVLQTCLKWVDVE